MKKALIALLSIVFIFVVSNAMASEPLQTVKTGVDRVIKVLKDPALKSQDKAKQRKEALREAVSGILDFREMAKRSLARQWRKLSDKQKGEFVELYRGLIERTYLKKIEAYQNEKIIYKGQRIRGKYAIVKTLVVTSKQTEIPVDYKLLKKGDNWIVYDVIIEGVSLVNNYRRQFKSIIRRSSYDGLVKMLREKNEKG